MHPDQTFERHGLQVLEGKGPGFFGWAPKNTWGVRNGKEQYLPCVCCPDNTRVIVSMDGFDDSCRDLKDQAIPDVDICRPKIEKVFDELYGPGGRLQELGEVCLPSQK